jgi:hypothetical protein
MELLGHVRWYAMSDTISLDRISGAATVVIATLGVVQLHRGMLPESVAGTALSPRGSGPCRAIRIEAGLMVLALGGLMSYLSRDRRVLTATVGYLVVSEVAYRVATTLGE